jgi:hypothetical protein
MICYRDRSYCSQFDCVTAQCDRNPQTALNELAEIEEDKRLPLSISDFKDTDFCKGYMALGALIGIKGD